MGKMLMQIDVTHANVDATTVKSGVTLKMSSISLVLLA